MHTEGHAPGRIALLGSGETSLAGGRVFEALARVLPTPLRVAVLDTPAGFELNSARVAGRVADFLEFAELMVRDALERDESCGGHFREEHQTPDGEAQRDDARFSHVAVWEYAGEGQSPRRHEEPLAFEYVKPSQRSYK